MTWMFILQLISVSPLTPAQAVEVLRSSRSTADRTNVVSVQANGPLIIYGAAREPQHLVPYEETYAGVRAAEAFKYALVQREMLWQSQRPYWLVGCASCASRSLSGRIGLTAKKAR